MKIIIIAKITDGYPKWRDAFVSADTLREKHGLKVLAWGHPKGDENKVAQIQATLDDVDPNKAWVLKNNKY